MSVTRARLLVDTNVLFYRVDFREPAKQAVAHALLAWLRGAHLAAVSTQVLMELTEVLRKKGPTERMRRVATSLARDTSVAFPVLSVTAEVVAEALRGVEQYGLPTWDAQLWATARVHGLPCIVTEDVPGARVIDGVRYLDPFATDFDLAALEALR